MFKLFIDVYEFGVSLGLAKRSAKALRNSIKRTTSNSTIRAIAISFVFMFSAVGASVLINPVGASPNSLAPASSPAPVASASVLTAAEANWEGADAQFNYNYNPQTVINSSDAHYVGINWLFPFPGHPAPLLTVSLGQGSIAPMIINGTLYVLAQDDQVFALNAANGDVLWTTVLPITANSTFGHDVGKVDLHIHGDFEAYTTTLFNNTPTFWASGADQKIYALNALTGAYELNFTDFAGTNTIPGNNPNAIESSSAGLLVDQKDGIVITSIESGSSAATGRCFFRGWNVLVSPPKLAWTAFCTPPQPGGNLTVDPDWDISQVSNMSSAEIFYPGPAYDGGGNIPGTAVVNLKTLSPEVLNSTLYNDWGYVDQSSACSAADAGGSTGATSAGWGGPWVLGTGPTAGLAFLPTNNPDPYNSACKPGPGLWADSILALNVTTGQWVWGFQESAHDMWDYDCSWWQSLGNETVNGVSTQVLWKTCKGGYLFEINALTGALIWAWTPPASIQPRCDYCYLENPLNSTEMQLAFPNPSLKPTIMYPYTFAFEGEDAYNPVTNYIYIVADNNPRLVYYVAMNSSNYASNPGSAAYGPTGGPTEGTWDNCTVVAVDAATGQLAWSYQIPIQGYRGAITTSGNIVFATLSSGDLLMLNAQNGSEIRDMYIGGPLNVGVQVGATINGTVELFVPITIGEEDWAGAETVPGGIVALALQNYPPIGTSGVSPPSTSVTTTTVTSTATSVTTAAGSVSTTTVTSTSTSDALYGVAAVAVIFIVVSGYLAMRGRKPTT
jgi:outer membrane protein assembly factor BamB